MAILTMPAAPAPARSSFVPLSNTAAHTSPLNQATQTQVWPGRRWSFQATYPPIADRAVAAKWQIFLLALDGQAGRFLGYDHNAYIPGTSIIGPRSAVAAGSIAALGTPLVDGAGQSGAVLLTKGWTPGMPVLLEGDYVAYAWDTDRYQLHMVTADVAADGSGDAAIPILPAIRYAPPGDAALVLERPGCTMMLTGNDGGGWDTDDLRHYGFTVSAVEALV